MRGELGSRPPLISYSAASCVTVQAHGMFVRECVYVWVPVPALPLEVGCPRIRALITGAVFNTRTIFHFRLILLRCFS
jgi:hypothetical protein